MSLCIGFSVEISAKDDSPKGNIGLALEVGVSRIICTSEVYKSSVINKIDTVKMVTKKGITTFFRRFSFKTETA